MQAEGSAMSEMQERGDGFDGRGFMGGSVRGPAGLVCMPWAAVSLGSSWSALLTLEAEAASLVGLEIEAGEDEVGGDVGMEVEGGLGFGAGVGRGCRCVRGPGRGRRGRRRCEESAAMAAWNSCSASGMQALGEVVVAELGVLGGLLGGGRVAMRMARIWSSWKAAWRKEASE